MSDEMHTPLWRTRSGLVLCGFLIVAGFYLVTEHTAHVFGALPFLLLLACPLMHLFMHHGHGGHGGHGDVSSRSNPSSVTADSEVRHEP
jgi:Protein of unknown function (DUF2933)